MVTFSVKEICMGQNHMLALGCDRLAAQDEPILEYAEGFFTNMKRHLADYGRRLFREQNPELNASAIRDKDLVEKALKDYFKDDKNRWPAAKWSTFSNLVFKDMKVIYGIEMEGIIEKLQQDIAEKGSYNMINLRTLRNQIMGRTITENVIFGWGLNDERLCRDTEDLDPMQNYENKYTAAKMLHQLNFKKVKRIACGDSFSLALTEEGRIYSWGIGQNGSLGLGDTVLMTPTPKRLQFSFPRQTIFFDNRASAIESIRFKAIACG